MSFWRSFGFHPISHIETILDRDQYTLEELLDEDEFLQECKLQNQRLIDYLVKPEQLSLLFEYVTKEAPEDADRKRKDSYPYLASEILCMDISALIDTVYRDENKYLSQLYEILDQPNFNLSLSSHISKVAINFLSRKTIETMSYIKKQENIIDKFIKHLDKSPVVEILLKIISIEEFPGGAGTLEWLDKSDLIGGIVAKFDPALDSEFHENASFILSEIVELNNSYTESPLIVKLEGEEMIKKLYTFILNDVPLGTSFLHGLTVIIKLLRRHKENNTNDNTATPLEELGSLFKESLVHVQDLNETLKKTTDDSFTTTTGLLSPPLGFYRLKIIEFFADLINSRYLCIDTKFIELSILTTCLDLFFQYPWNNLLHSQVSQICQIVLGSDNEELKLSLLKDSQLVDKIIQGDEDNTKEISKEKGIRYGYMGFLNHIARVINESRENPTVKQMTDENPRWATFVKNSLQPVLNLESEPLGDFKISLMMQPEVDDDDDDQNYDNDNDGFDNSYNQGFGGNYQQNHMSLDDEDEYDQQFKNDNDYEYDDAELNENHHDHDELNHTEENEHEHLTTDSTNEPPPASTDL